MGKGPKYREPKTINLDNEYTSVSFDLEEFVKSWSKKGKMATQCFNGWYNKVQKSICENIEDTKRLYKLPKFQSVFINNDAISCLTELQSNFVVVPVDKAAKDIVLICKSYYMEVLLNEMITKASTYKCLTKSLSLITKINYDFSKSLKN